MKILRFLMPVLFGVVLTAPPLFTQEAPDEDPAMPSGTDGQVQLRNVGNSEWSIVGTQGDGVSASLGGSMIHLEVGGRYHIDLSTVDSERYPFDLRGMNGRVLISQQEDAGADDLGDANPDVTEEGVSFTLTEELAERIVYFRAATYPGMVGFVSPWSEDTAQAEEGADTGDGASGDGGEQGGQEGGQQGGAGGG